MSIDTIDRPAVSPGDMAASRPDGAEIDSDPFDLDISFIEHGPKADTVIAMTDDGCGSTCPSACTTSVSA
ncbi:MAG: FxLD family lanthipeptide [Pseudonocardiaceae bacterium]